MKTTSSALCTLIRSSIAIRMFWAVPFYLLPVLLLMTSNSFAQTGTALTGNGNVFLTAKVLGTGGSGPTAVAAADFNKDGHLDFVVTNSGNNNVGVLLGNGDGTFQDPKITSVACNPNWVTVGDFNGDGIPDVAVVAPGCFSTVVDVLLSQGDGTFSVQSISFPGAETVTAGDFNGDGKLDLAVVAQGQGSSDTVTILFGNGDGTFQTPGQVTSLGGLVGAWQAVVGDFNKDGHQDLAISTRNEFGSTASGKDVIVLLGNGDGTFRSPLTLALPTAGYGIAIADFNKDGNLDLVATTPADGGVSVFLGDGAGNFTPVNNPGSLTLPTASAFIPAFAGPTSVAVGDFNNDGKPDIIVALGGIANQMASVAVLLGNGDGTLGPQLLFGTAPSGASVAVGDFNGDGKLDWVATTNNPVDSATVALGLGDGTFQAARVFISGNAPVYLAFADFKGNGILDAVVTNSPDNDISMLLGNGDGTFQAPVNMPFPAIPGGVVTGDFNNDGKQDFAVRAGFGNPTTVAVFLGNGDGTFQAPKSSSTGGLSGSSIVAGDFNGDGKLDLAVSNSDGTSPNIAILLGNGDGTFGTPIITPTGGGSLFSLAAADFNRDGHLDLITTDNTNGDVAIFLGNGDGTFKAPIVLARKFANVAAVGDFNKDGNPDFVVTSGDGFAYVYLGNGDGTFGAPTTVTLGTPTIFGPTWVGVADFNLDGKLDFVVGEPSLRATSIPYEGIQLLQGNGDGTFQPVQDYLAGAGNVFVQAWIGDFDQSGAPDIAVLDLQNSILVLLNQGPALSVTLSGSGSGSVTSSPAGINCPAACSANFRKVGTMVTLTETPASGSRFVGWSGACGGAGTCVVTMSQAESVTATFTQVFALSVTVAGGGTVTSSPSGITCPGTCSATFDSGTTVMLTATPTSGWSFSGWGGACTGTGICSVTMSAAESVTATFTQVFTLSVTVVGSGTVTSSPAAISCPGTCTASFNSGTMVTLTATPVAGSSFAGWSAPCSGTGSCTITMNAASSVTATFGVVTFQLTVSLAGSGGGTVTSSPGGINCSGPAPCTANFNSGTSVTLSAAAATGSAFVGWSGACSGTGTCTLIMSGGQSATATFSPVFALTVVVAGRPGSGSVASSPPGINCPGTCSASFTAGTVVNLTPTPQSAFVLWQTPAACGPSSGAKIITCSVTMNMAQTAKAVFR